MSPRLIPLLVVLTAVSLGVLSAIVLKTMADAPTLGMGYLAVGLASVVAINAGRVVAWGYAHKKYPLSNTYPFTSLFFPVMLIVSRAYGEPASWEQVGGVLLIVAGVGWLTWRSDL